MQELNGAEIKLIRRHITPLCRECRGGSGLALLRVGPAGGLLPAIGAARPTQLGGAQRRLQGGAASGPAALAARRRQERRTRLAT